MDTPDKLTPRHVLEGQALMDYLVERAAERAKDAIIERDERRKRLVTLVCSIIALVGISSLVSIFKIYVRSELDVFNDKLEQVSTANDKKLDAKGKLLLETLQTQVGAVVKTQIEDQIGAVKKILDEDDIVERYVELALELPEKLAGIHERDDKYVTEKLSEVIQAAELLAQLKPFTRNRRRFLMSTRQVVDVMTRFNRETEINRLDDLFGGIMTTDHELSRTLVDHYGELVVGSPRPIESQALNMERLQRYMQAAHDLSYPEKSLVWSVFIEFKRNGFQASATVTSLLQSSTDLAIQDRAEFWYKLMLYTNSMYWMLAPDQQGRELEQLMAHLQRAYPQVTEMMDDNLEAHEYLQTRIAALKEKNPAWRQVEPNPVVDPTEQPPETAAQPETTPTEPSAPATAEALDPQDSELMAPATALRPSEANTLRQ